MKVQVVKKGNKVIKMVESCPWVVDVPPEGKQK
jgi:hypothetical protein